MTQIRMPLKKSKHSQRGTWVRTKTEAMRLAKEKRRKGYSNVYIRRYRWGVGRWGAKEEGVLGWTIKWVGPLN